MLSVTDVSLAFGKRVLFDDVNIQFSPGNCYGLIGANGAGKSTFVKIMSGEIEADSGDIIMGKGQRMGVLKQNHFEFDDVEVLNTVLMGHKRLFEVIKTKDAIYANPNATDDDYMKAGDLEAEFGELGGYDAEAEVGSLLNGLGIDGSLHNKLMKDLEANQKVRVLLAQALFGNPDVLLLDEPTNDLDRRTIAWLEEFLINFQNTVIVVSHDRHFLDNVCTHIADIDFGKIQVYTGNYSFWYESSQLALQLKRDQNKKMEDKKKDLESFIRRFSSNASKSKQASSRKKTLEKMDFNEIKPSSRKYPHIFFGFEKEIGNDVFRCEDLKCEYEGEVLFSNLAINLAKGERVAFVSRNDMAVTKFYEIVMGELEQSAGDFHWGGTIDKAYFPKDNVPFFKDCNLSIVDWLRQYTNSEEETFVRGFLGKMLFSGDESQKKAQVLSGGEKVRCMLSRIMLQEANTVILDEPTGHLDLESITSLNEGMKTFKGVMLFSSQDHELVNTTANRIIELGPKGMIDSFLSFDEFLVDVDVAKKRQEIY